MAECDHLIYPDDIGGALQAVIDKTGYTPDNVLKILDNGNHYLIFLKGYKDHYGDIRKYNNVVLSNNQ
jgi:hypothetical protein